MYVVLQKPTKPQIKLDASLQSNTNTKAIQSNGNVLSVGPTCFFDLNSQITV